jgi:hypothetical protein
MKKILSLTVLGCVASFALTHSASAQYWSDDGDLVVYDQGHTETSTNGGLKNYQMGPTSGGMYTNSSGLAKSWVKSGTPLLPWGMQSSNQTTSMKGKTSFIWSGLIENTVTPSEIHCSGETSLSASHDLLFIMNQGSAGTSASIITGTFVQTHPDSVPPPPPPPPNGIYVPPPLNITSLNHSINSNNQYSQHAKGKIIIELGPSQTVSDPTLFKKYSGSVAFSVSSGAGGSRWQVYGGSYEATAQITFTLDRDSF